MHLRPSDDHFDDASKVFGKFDHGGDSSHGQRTYHSLAHHWFLISANLAAAGRGMAAVGHLRPYGTSSAIGCRAPIPAVRRVESNGQGRTHFGHSPFADLRLGVSFTEYGIECLRQTIADKRAAGHAPPQVKPPK